MSYLIGYENLKISCVYVVLLFLDHVQMCLKLVLILSDEIFLCLLSFLKCYLIR